MSQSYDLRIQAINGLYIKRVKKVKQGHQACRYILYHLSQLLSMLYYIRVLQVNKEFKVAKEIRENME